MVPVHSYWSLQLLPCKVKGVSAGVIKFRVLRRRHYPDARRSRIQGEEGTVSTRHGLDSSGHKPRIPAATRA